MRRRLHQSVQREARQFDLFGPPDQMHTKREPEWRQLPEEARQTATGLMARLLVEHESGDRRSLLAGGSRDD
jgi:hypothetical protein